MKKILVLGLVFIGFILLANLGLAEDHHGMANHWYTEGCCGWNDCHPIDSCSEIIQKANGWVQWQNYDFNPDQIHPSHDNQCHVCIHSYGGPTGSDLRPVCIYTQQGS